VPHKRGGVKGRIRHFIRQQLKLGEKTVSINPEMPNLAEGVCRFTQKERDFGGIRRVYI
jgi:hypothetical protein